MSTATAQVPVETPSAPIPLRAKSAMPTDAALALERASVRELETVMVRGTMPVLADLVGWEFRGMNHPAWARVAGIKKFMKGFFRDPGRDPSSDGDRVYGYNCPVEQNALDGRWRAKPDDAAPKRFGFYQVAPVDPTRRDNRYLHAVLLDYGAGGNKPWDPTTGLRDYVVQVADDLYLGKAYYALGPLRLSTNFFILERHRRGITELARR